MEKIAGLGILGTVGLAVVGFGLIAVLIVWIIKEAEKARARAAARLAAMQALADQNGLSFRAHLDDSHDEEFWHFEIFQRGFDRFAHNTIVGEIGLEFADWSGTGRVKAGDFKYKTRETTTTTDSKGRTTTRTRIVNHNFSYFVLELPFEKMPDMVIRREHMFDKLASFFGKDDIDFESGEFSRKYFVKSASRKFAYDVVNQRMIEFLLETQPGLVDLENRRICLSDGYSAWNAERFGASLDWTIRFLEHWPAFLVKDLQEGKQV
jgi:hypothetical protein